MPGLLLGRTLLKSQDRIEKDGQSPLKFENIKNYGLIVFNNEKPFKYNEKIFNRKKAETNNLMMLQNYHTIQKPFLEIELLIDCLE
jgi:hypothetical protein